MANAPTKQLASKRPGQPTSKPTGRDWQRELWAALDHIASTFPPTSWGVLPLTDAGLFVAFSRNPAFKVKDDNASHKEREQVAIRLIKAELEFLTMDHSLQADCPTWGVLVRDPSGEWLAGDVEVAAWPAGWEGERECQHAEQPKPKVKGRRGRRPSAGRKIKVFGWVELCKESPLPEVVEVIGPKFDDAGRLTECYDGLAGTWFKTAEQARRAALNVLWAKIDWEWSAIVSLRSSKPLRRGRRAK